MGLGRCGGTSNSQVPPGGRVAWGGRAGANKRQSRAAGRLIRSRSGCCAAAETAPPHPSLFPSFFATNITLAHENPVGRKIRAMRPPAAPPAAAAASVQWLRMADSDTTLRVEPSGSAILRGLGNHSCNLVSIFGAARQGKSFLMNALAGQEDMFRISNAREPCTQGVDLCSHVMPLSKFAEIQDTDDRGMAKASGNALVGVTFLAVRTTP